MSLPAMLDDLPTACDVGMKKDSKGYKSTWVGYKLHIDVADGQRGAVRAQGLVARPPRTFVTFTDVSWSPAVQRADVCSRPFLGRFGSTSARTADMFPGPAGISGRSAAGRSAAGPDR